MLLYYTKYTRYDENLMKRKQYVTMVRCLVYVFYFVWCAYVQYSHACVCVCVNVFVFLFFHFMFNVSRRKRNLNGSLKNHLQHFTWTRACACAHSFIGGCPALYLSYYVCAAVHSQNQNCCCCCWFRFYMISFVLYFCMRVRILYCRLITFRLFEN